MPRKALMIAPGYTWEMQGLTRGLTRVGAQVVGLGDSPEGALPAPAREAQRHRVAAVRRADHRLAARRIPGEARMSKVARVNATLDQDLLARVDEYAARHREDRSTAIRQLLDTALRSLAEQDAIDAYRSGRITLRELAAALNLSVWGAHDLLAARGVAIAQGTMAETASDLAALLEEGAPAG